MSNTDKERKEAVALMNASDELDEACDDGSQEALEVEESAEINGSVETPVQQASSTEVTTAPVVNVLEDEVKVVGSNETKVEDKSSIIADIENERVSKSPYILEGISFKTGSSILTKTSKKQIDAIANALKKHKNVKINLRGHTDNMGSTKDNEKLSTKRADSVGFAFVDRGVNIDNIWIQGMGELDPIVKNGTAKEMAKNRRVDIAVIK
jgi:outer membrane protein OmpA-like peptidoglycan-associated protein